MTTKSKTVKVVINRCYGGFRLSKKAIARIAELQGRKCYFFTNGRTEDGRTDFNTYKATTIEAENDYVWFAFDIPNPDEVLREKKPWNDMTDAERKAHDRLYRKHSIEGREIPRDDPVLVRVVEEMGAEAADQLAELKIVKIPAGVKWKIDEYDGMEKVCEVHREW